MSFMDFDLPIPLEMQADSLDMWGWPMKTVKIEVREAIQLGYKFMPRRAPMISGLNEVSRGLSSSPSYSSFRFPVDAMHLRLVRLGI